MESQIERPWESDALNKGWRISTVHFDISRRAAADTNKLLQREQTTLVSPFLMSALHSPRKLCALCCSFFCSYSRSESTKRQWKWKAGLLHTAGGSC